MAQLIVRVWLEPQTIEVERRDGDWLARGQHPGRQIEVRAEREEVAVQEWVQRARENSKPLTLHERAQK